MGNCHVSSVAPPPPPPSSPPPIPPSPPKSASSPFSISRPRVHGSGDNVIATNLVGDNASMHDNSQNLEGGSFCEVGSLPRNVPVVAGNEMLNLSPPPSKPTEAKTIQRIEDLCQLIAKNGPGVEDVTRQKEYGNPEYEFLLGGEPGSEAAIGHEYFLWLKNKCLLTTKSHEGHREPAFMPLQVGSLTQPEPLMASAGFTLSDDSDMEMEDDITISDKDREMNQSTGALLTVKELDDKEQLQSEGLTSKSASKVHSQVMYSVGGAECLLDSHLEKSVSPLADNLSASCASVAVEANNSEKCSELIKGGSPIRLLQDYASDGSSEDDDQLLHEGLNPSTVLPSFIAGASSHNKDTGSCIGKDPGSKSRHCLRKDEKGSGQLSDSQGEVKDAGIAFIATVRADECLDNNPGNKSFAIDATSHVDFQRKVTLDCADAHVISKRGKTKENEEKKEKSESASLKVDEFGRLVREGSIDSESDSGYTDRHVRRGKRGRSRSRSRSPLDRRRTRRSLRRRKEKRSRSRSRSPRNQRSRSRSPSYRRADEFGGEKLRSDRGRVPECFDFLRGRCNRGASCRYMHPEVDKSNSSRRYRSKQKYREVPSSTKNYKTNKETKKSHEEHVSDEAQIQGMKGGKVDWRRKDIVMDSQQSVTLDRGSWLIDSSMVKYHSPGEVTGTVQEKQIIREKSAEPNPQVPDNKTSLEESDQKPSVDVFPSHYVGGTNILNSHGDTTPDMLPLVKSTVIHQPQSNTSVAEVQNTDFPCHQMDDSSVSDASPDQTSLASSPKKFSKSELFPNNVLPAQSLPNASSCQEHSSEPAALPYPSPKVLSSPTYSGPTIPQQYSQLPPPPPPAATQSTNAPHMRQLPMDYSLMPQVASYALQSAHARNLHAYHQASLANQHPQLSVPPSSSWTSLPPPPPRPSYDLRFNTETATPGVSSQFQHSPFPPRNDLCSQISVRLSPSELHSNSQFSEFLHQAYPLMQEFQRPKLENSGSGKPISPFVAASLFREDHITHQDFNTSLGHGSLHQTPLPSQELAVNKMLPISSDLPSGELVKSTSQIHPFSHRQQAASHLQYPLGDSSAGMPGKAGSTSQYPLDLLDRNRSSDPDFGVSRISAHYNPYASTFEQPLSSKFRSSAFGHDKGVVCGNQYDTPFSLSYAAVDGQGVGSFGSRQTTSSPSSARAVGQILPRASGDQYDPLFDSVEPSSNAKRKVRQRRKWEPATDSDPKEKHSGSQKPLDLEENNRHEVAAVASITSMNNDEFGETADAEVGAVENESPSNLVGLATTGEIETERKSSGKKKKKDSKSSKHFKTAIADFVKDVLKPSWRQGNMSKEAFKTIVKKTVDKVSGAMKGHQIPKSQAKIDHYIDSSQRKLTRLVMGYVDKYVKV
ncbi:Zinc finger, CCCH-type [Parasponia andersonii]|uniref:Zinc finger, CCCH-type n=1 Tax=Parasponia andersonii TaxID=3476 RepID=A0A2P5DB93_PARAD|nr:Zinc finger, CCCH-type [Parasponia andersonii]